MKKVDAREMETTLDEILRYFEHCPQRSEVARVLLENGIGVHNGGLFVNKISIPFESVADAAKVESRNVKKTVKDIESDPTLKSIFKHLKARPSTEQIGRVLTGTSVLEISAEDASSANIAAPVLAILARHALPVRTMVCEDCEMYPEPKMLVVVKGAIPDGLTNQLSSLAGIKSVAVFSRSEG